eukprot:TRINITY_DN11687_c0_g1_i1.p1 TRINITY_DN11687_c0_g1~~TRINITY_DN11687_c0_g1_i1.p1  ORF type:complete len:264 (-),score=46.10 TRINITY_DN11687_c0_g1_i1:61-783(-)
MRTARRGLRCLWKGRYYCGYSEISGRCEEVLGYWFGVPDVPLKEKAARYRTQKKFEIPPAVAKKWYAQEDSVDEEIRVDYSGMIKEIMHEKNQVAKYLQDGPRGALTITTLLDQFPRNIWREKPKSFAYDYLAQSICLDQIQSGQIQLFEHPQHVALMLHPLMHAENAQLQQLSVEKFEELVANTPEDDYSFPLVQGNLKFARLHQKVFQRFNRFPNRNIAMGRASTPDELDHLEKGMWH